MKRAKSRLVSRRNRQSNGRFKRINYFNKTWRDYTILFATTAFFYAMAGTIVYFDVPDQVEIAKAEDQVEVVVEQSNDATAGGTAFIASESATSTPAPLTEKQQILMYTIEVFGDKADEAIQIIKCESGYNPENHGDKHLMSINNQTGELIGDSIGLFQIRTGDTSWNRARKEGMSVEEFRSEMRKPLENIKYAKKLYDAQGWTPWFNCMNKTGVGEN